MRHWRVYGHRADGHRNGSDAHNRIAHWDDAWDHAGWTRGRKWQRRLDYVSGGADGPVHGDWCSRDEQWRWCMRSTWSVGSDRACTWWRYLTRWATTLRRGFADQPRHTRWTTS